MKRIAFVISILVFLLAACNLSATVTPTVPGMPTATELPASTEVPVLGSTRTSEIDGMMQVFVPGGDFAMGSDTSTYANERPVHTVTLDSFWIDQTEVTNAMFGAFVAQTGYQTDAETTGASSVYNPDTDKNELVPGTDWQHPLGPGSSLADLAQHPVVHVSWNDAQAYCQWAGRRLPTEAEWEKAARGTDGWTYPWGNDFDGTRLNFADVTLGAFWGDSNFDDGFQLTAPVGNYPAGASPYGALDMSGNVWEWVNDWVDEAYYQSSPSIPHRARRFVARYRRRAARGLPRLDQSWGYRYYSWVSLCALGMRRDCPSLVLIPFPPHPFPNKKTPPPNFGGGSGVRAVPPHSHTSRVSSPGGLPPHPPNSNTASHTASTCPSSISGYIGRLSTSLAARSLSGRSPSRYPRSAYAACKCTGTG
jgi:formylglycine-generating enzyme required for sulfatase activity